MDIKQLVTFMELSETLNYRKAAQRLQYAPSTLFKHIQLLDQELGVVLFYKSGQQMQLTKEGEQFRVYAERMLSAYHDALDRFATDDNQEETIAIGGCEMNTANSLIKLLGGFSRARPNVRMSMMTSPNANVPEMVRGGLIDVGYYYCLSDQKPPAIGCRALYQEPAYLMVSRNNPLAARRKLKYEDLRGRDFVHPHGTCCFMVEFLRRLDDRKIALKKTSYPGGMHLVVEQVQKGDAITLVAHGASAHIGAQHDMVALDMDEAPMRFWETILFKQYESLKPATKSLIRHSVNYAQEALENDRHGVLEPPASLFG